MVVVLVGGGGSSLSEHTSIVVCCTALRLHKFTSGWDPPTQPTNFLLLDFGSMNSLQGGIRLLEQFPSA